MASPLARIGATVIAADRRLACLHDAPWRMCYGHQDSRMENMIALPTAEALRNFDDKKVDGNNTACIETGNNRIGSRECANTAKHIDIRTGKHFAHEGMHI